MERKTVAPVSKYVIADTSGLVFLKKLDTGPGIPVTGNLEEAELISTQLEAEMMIYGMSCLYPLSRLNTVFFYDGVTTTVVKTEYSLKRITPAPEVIK